MIHRHLIFDLSALYIGASGLSGRNADYFASAVTRQPLPFADVSNAS